MTAARCMDCGRPQEGADGCAAHERNADAYGWTDDCYRATIERLKAENASLLESLREARVHTDAAETLRDEVTVMLRAAEQRAEAAEKALEYVEHIWNSPQHLITTCPMCMAGDPRTRAALHGEERPAPPEESYGGIDRASAGRFEVPTGLTVEEALRLVLRDAALSPDGNTYITLTDTEYRAARAVLVEPHMLGATEKHARVHSGECGGQPAGSGCICGVGFDDEERSAPPSITREQIEAALERGRKDREALEAATPTLPGYFRGAAAQGEEK